MAGPATEPANLRFLRRLVTVLTLVMIAGLVAVTATFVIRLRPAPAVALPASLVLPDGAVAHAVTRTPGEWIVTTRDGRVLVFAPDGTPRGEVAMR